MFIWWCGTYELSFHEDASYRWGSDGVDRGDATRICNDCGAGTHAYRGDAQYSMQYVKCQCMNWHVDHDDGHHHEDYEGGDDVEQRLEEVFLFSRGD